MAYGFSHDNVTAVEAALLAHPVWNVIAKTTKSPLGMKYSVECTLTAPDGRVPASGPSGSTMWTALRRGS